MALAKRDVMIEASRSDPVPVLHEAEGLAAILRDEVTQRRSVIRRLYEGGATGAQVSSGITELADEVIGLLWDRFAARSEGVTLAALGGYGRREMAAYSDVDLLWLHRPKARKDAEAVAGRVVRMLWDAGITVGHSVRTIEDCIEMGHRDLRIRTAMMEARYLEGDRALFEQFQRDCNKRLFSKQPDRFISEKLSERKSESFAHGEAVSILEPHLKKSPGGLRDLHLIRWAALTCRGVGTWDRMKEEGLITKQEHLRLVAAEDFLWRVRHELHFNAGRCQDHLIFEEQVRVARRLGYEDIVSEATQADRVLGVERFMQDYYRHTGVVSDLTQRILERLHRPGWTLRFRAWFLGRRLGEDLSLAGGQLRLRTLPPGPVVLESVLRLLLLSQQYDAGLSSDTQSRLIEQLDREGVKRGDLDGRLFLELLRIPEGLGRSLRFLHRVGLLELLIPPFAKARGLMQFNQYHRYTVDEHCLRAVEEAAALRDHPGLLGRVYREISRKDLLHLSVLLHDLGKGHAEDHSLAGERLAIETGRHLDLTIEEQSLVAFLVRHHLVMAHTAFRRDVTEPAVLIRFVRLLTTPKRLKKLYVLTAADLAAVGGGMMNRWKEDLLGLLYTPAIEALSGERVVGDEPDRLDRVRRAVLEGGTSRFGEEWLTARLSAMPDRYLLTTPAERILQHLDWIKKLQSHTEQANHSPPVLIQAVPDAERGVVEYTLYTQDGPGLFAKIARCFAARGQQILHANIITWKDGTVVDGFFVRDPDYEDRPPQSRLDGMIGLLRGVLEGKEHLGPPAPPRLGHRALPLTEPTQVEVDNESSDRYTILDVFAQDRPGLLAVMAQVLWKQGLSVHNARVSTRLDQAVDAFYVSDREGRKITDAERLTRLRMALKDQIDAFLTAT
jgi:[protein-PII] uridylyltransferase